MNDQLYWSNGKVAREIDLAGLVCNNLDPERPCANPCRGQEGGDTWEKRRQCVDRITMEL